MTRIVGRVDVGGCVDDGWAGVTTVSGNVGEACEDGGEQGYCFMEEGKSCAPVDVSGENGGGRRAPVRCRGFFNPARTRACAARTARPCAPHGRGEGGGGGSVTPCVHSRDDGGGGGGSVTAPEGVCLQSEPLRVGGARITPLCLPRVTPVDGAKRGSSRCGRSFQAFRTPPQRRATPHQRNVRGAPNRPRGPAGGVTGGVHVFLLLPHLGGCATGVADQSSTHPPSRSTRLVPQGSAGQTEGNWLIHSSHTSEPVAPVDLSPLDDDWTHRLA